jgi:hypothetical protein
MKALYVAACLLATSSAALAAVRFDEWSNMWVARLYCKHPYYDVFYGVGRTKGVAKQLTLKSAKSAVPPSTKCTLSPHLYKLGGPYWGK